MSAMDPNDNRGPQLQAVCITFISLATVAVSLRAYVRSVLLKVFGIEDAFMVAAWCTYLMFVTAALGGIHWGTGRHMTVLTPMEQLNAMRYWWVCYIGYTTTMIAVKLSVGLTLIRLTVYKLHIRILYTIMATSVVTGTIFFLLTIFQCTPVPYFWTRFIGAQGSCLDISIIQDITYAYSAVNTVTDFTFGILPIFMIKGLNMDKKSKIMLVPILSMACIASAAILVRMAFIKDFSNPDFLYATTDIAIWSCTEQGLAITAGSLATLRPLFRLLSEKFGLSKSRSEDRNPTPQFRPSGSRKQLAPQFGVLSFRSNDAADTYHKMDDMTPSSSRVALANKAHERDLEEGVAWTTVDEGVGGDRTSHGPGKLQIEKQIEIETRVDPRYE